MGNPKRLCAVKSEDFLDDGGDDAEGPLGEEIGHGEGAGVVEAVVVYIVLATIRQQRPNKIK